MFTASREPRDGGRGSARRRLTAVAAAGAIVLAVTAACSGGGSSTAGSGEIPKVAKNQTITVGVATLQQQYADPVLANEGGNTYPIKWSVGEPLVRQDLDTTWVPGLATKWTLSADKLTWTFNLRKGVTMHDGSAFTADDVKTSIDRVKDPEFTSYATFSSQIAKVDVIDPLTVAITSNKPYANLPFDAPPPIATAYYEKVGEEEFRKKPVAAGPFKFDSQKFNDSMTLTRFDEFWDTSRIANFKTLVLKIIPDESSRVSGLQTGEIDIAQGVTPNSAVQLKGNKDVKLVEVKDASAAGLFVVDNYFPEASKLKDPRVRKALLMAIDRQSIADSLYRGYGKVPPNITLPVTLGNDESLKAVPYDPAGAKKLLAAAGASDLSFDFSYYNQTTAITDVQKLAEAVGGYWTDIGVKVKLDAQDPATYLDKAVKHQHRGIIILGVPGLLVTDPAKYSIYVASKGAYTTQQGDDKLDTLLADIESSTDPAAKEKLGGELSRYLYDENYVLPAISLTAVYAVGPKVAQFKPMEGSPYPGPFWNLRAY